MTMRSKKALRLQPSKRLKQYKRKATPLTLTDAQAIIASVRDDYRVYLTVRFLAGLRQGEAVGLKWKHVDFERRQLRIRETLRRNIAEHIKTGAARREVDISQVVHDALMSIRPDDRPEVELDERYVFCTPNGRPLNDVYFNERIWKPLLRNLGLEQHRPHQMRETCAAIWSASGKSPEWIAKQLGVALTETFFCSYGHYLLIRANEEGNSFDGATSRKATIPANDSFFAASIPLTKNRGSK